MARGPPDRDDSDPAGERTGGTREMSVCSPGASVAPRGIIRTGLIAGRPHPACGTPHLPQTGAPSGKRRERAAAPPQLALQQVAGEQAARRRVRALVALDHDPALVA